MLKKDSEPNKGLSSSGPSDSECSSGPSREPVMICLAQRHTHQIVDWSPGELEVG